MDDQQLKYFVRANLGNPAALATRARQEGFGVADIARVSGYTPTQIEQHFARAGVALPGPGAVAQPAVQQTDALPGGSAGSGLQAANGAAGAPVANPTSNAVGMGGPMGQTGTAAGPAPSGLTQATPTSPGAPSNPSTTAPMNPVAAAPASTAPQQQDAAQAAQVLQAMAQNGKQGAQADSNPSADQQAFTQGFQSVRTNPYPR